MSRGRRVVFAAPLVAVGCAQPAAPVHTSPMPLAASPPPPHVALVPIGSRPEPVPHHHYPAPAEWDVVASEPDGVGSRVQLRRADDQFDERWTIAGCTTIDWDDQHVDCHSDKPPKRLGATMTVSPPGAIISVGLVGSLPPLGRKHASHGCDETRPHATCNPPPPTRWQPGHDGATAKVVEGMVVGASVRVRFRRWSEAMNETWGAYFVDEKGVPVRDGECRITGWDWGEVECESSPWAEEVTTWLRVSPPQRGRVLERDGLEVTVGFGRRSGIERDARIEVGGQPCAVISVDIAVTRCRLAQDSSSDEVVVWSAGKR